MPHVARPRVDPRYPVQVTIRATPGLPSLRSPRVFGALRRAITRASFDRFRVIHFSIQQDHGHFIVEGDEARRARGGVHGLAIRLALAVNRALGRKGRVVGDRYHARPLTTPRRMRTSMVYVLLNFRKHLRAPACIDPRSSGHHFGGWQSTPAATDVAPATALPGTWMARTGWRLAGGPLRVDEHPAGVPRQRDLNSADVAGGRARRRDLGVERRLCVRGGSARGDVTNDESRSYVTDEQRRQRAKDQARREQYVSVEALVARPLTTRRRPE